MRLGQKGRHAAAGAPDDAQCLALGYRVSDDVARVNGVEVGVTAVDVGAIRPRQEVAEDDVVAHPPVARVEAFPVPHGAGGDGDGVAIPQIVDAGVAPRIAVAALYCRNGTEGPT